MTDPRSDSAGDRTYTHPEMHPVTDPEMHPDLCLDDGTQDTRPPLVIIAGPTASGKSDAAVRLAHTFSGSVISADSMQVYRGMDIGSAKITQEEMQGIPHYLLDIVDPREDWNVVRFQQEADRAAAEILAQGRLPILAGGTGFYIQALLYHIDFTAMDADLSLRTSLTELAEREGPEAVHALLQQADPEAASQIHPNNVKRMIRAIEFARMSGGRISDHNREQRQRPPAYRAVFIVLTMPREQLYERIDRRVDRMMENGLLEEVIRLRDAGLTATDVSMQGLGYKQLLQYLDGQFSLEEAVRLIKRDSRHFAKRQLTWFRREPAAIFVDAADYAEREQLYGHLEDLVRQGLGL